METGGTVNEKRSSTVKIVAVAAATIVILALVGFPLSYLAGHSIGYALGHKQGQSSGYNSGYTSGYNKGNMDGYDSGYDVGLDDGKFAFYYSKPAQEYGVDNLVSELGGLEWTKTYQEGVFDCSEMSASLEQRLENEGWHTIIVVGNSPSGSGYHAWLLVETSADAYMPVESTDISVVLWSSPYFDNYFKYDRSFETIQDALAYSETEFDWWKS